jgi:2-oxoglutarate ferredoxin oxidoreductase subunit alpha
VAVPELNLGQLVTFIRARYLCDAVAVTKVEGKPFKVGELKRRFIEILEG